MTPDVAKCLQMVVGEKGINHPPAENHCFKRTPLLAALVGPPFTSHAQYKLEVKVKVAQLCPTLCDPMDYTVHGIFQDKILEWVAFPFSRGSSQPRDQTQVSHIAGRLVTS